MMLQRPYKRPRVDCSNSTNTYRFNDSTTADVILNLQLESSSSHDLDLNLDLGLSLECNVTNTNEVLYLHSKVLRRRSKYFSTLLSDRWMKDIVDGVISVNLQVSASIGTTEFHLEVLKLFYMEDFNGVIDSASAALSILPVALELLFEDCVKACIRFLEVVPWSEDEEKKVMSLIPLLNPEESQELLSRVSPVNFNSSEGMLTSLVFSVIHNVTTNGNLSIKNFTEKFFREFSSKRELVGGVLDQGFKYVLKRLIETMKDYVMDENIFDEEKEEQVLSIMARTEWYTQLAKANMTNLLWLVDLMIELRVADSAAKEWSEQNSSNAYLYRLFYDGEWLCTEPELLTMLLQCTNKFARAITLGSILAPTKVRLTLVKNWLSVLIALQKENYLIESVHRCLLRELEETFLSIISTLPMSDAEMLLSICHGLATDNVENCPHLVLAFNTWFRRANQPPHRPFTAVSHNKKD